MVVLHASRIRSTTRAAAVGLSHRMYAAISFKSRLAGAVNTQRLIQTARLLAQAPATARRRLHQDRTAHRGLPTQLLRESRPLVRRIADVPPFDQGTVVKLYSPLLPA